MSNPIEALKKWVHHFLFRILPPRAFLRVNGIKLPYRKTTVTTTHLLDGEEIEIKVTFGDISAVSTIVPIWFKAGMIHDYRSQRQYFPPDKLLKVAWFDPILDEQVEICNPMSELEPLFVPMEILLLRAARRMGKLLCQDGTNDVKPN